jgi:hypothetical protein
MVIAPDGRGGMCRRCVAMVALDASDKRGMNN